ncbi:hypothetical protein RI845_15935 [Thalassotalea nanhaiensis]|uniref:DUF4426 domain-containing protein n=1 Tax=Thalassotalea nanhaiensis TaxID=3065648 RepID=A0ABY9THU9_9GAMM|nr:hypothetical protein RI845_15935 [Colwelliaceae bacterium SQ345]
MFRILLSILILCSAQTFAGKIETNVIKLTPDSAANLDFFVTIDRFDTRKNISSFIDIAFPIEIENVGIFVSATLIQGKVENPFFKTNLSSCPSSYSDEIDIVSFETTEKEVSEFKIYIKYKNELTGLRTFFFIEELNNFSEYDTDAIIRKIQSSANPKKPRNRVCSY